MIQRTDCLVCGRPTLPSGEPSCDCLTHSLSHPVRPPEHGPDPADVARFPLEPPVSPATPASPVSPASPGPGEPAASPNHRRPRPRGRHRKAAATAGGAAAAVIGCTALAAAFLGGLPEGGDGPGVALPDGGRLPTPEPTEPDRTPDGTPEDPPDGTPEDPPRETPGPPPGEDVDASPAPEGEPSPSPGEIEGSGSLVTPEPSPSATDGAGTLPSENPTDPGTGQDPDPTPGPPAPTATDNPGPLVLSEGDRGPEVVELQRRLLQLNWLYEGPAHGRYDAATREAVAAFQAGYGVRGEEEGVYGVSTRARLEEITAEP